MYFQINNVFKYDKIICLYQKENELKVKKFNAKILFPFIFLAKTDLNNIKLYTKTFSYFLFKFFLFY